MLLGDRGIGTVHVYSNGNGNEWELWLPGLYYWNASEQQWRVLTYGPYHRRWSGPHPFGGHRAWEEYPSGQLNAFSQYSWGGVSSGWYYAVINWNWSPSAGWDYYWSFVLGDVGQEWFVFI